MAKIYAAPTEIPVPEPDYKNYKHEVESRRQEDYLKALAAYLRENYEGDLVGEEIYTPRADGYARYMIMSHKPFALVHIALGDRWRADPVWERGLRLSDARKMVERDKSMSKLFGRS
jgi:hypothetical protein